MGGKRPGAGRHAGNCDCEKCLKKHGSRPVDGNLARKIKAKIKAEEKWILVIDLATKKALRTENTADLRNALEYLDNRDLGNTTDNVNHMHDKPLEVNATLTLGEGMRLAMQKAEERVRSRK
jgi:hypothetical protein